jgi:hypothetical protein
MRRQAEALKGESDGRKKHGNRVSKEGTNQTAGNDEEREFLDNVFG